MKINLEKELIKRNAKIATPEELLLIKEHEKLGELGTDLSRVGITHLHEAKILKDHKDRMIEESLRFEQSRVFHISQIQEVAEKYYLRFLPSYYYKGSVDTELPFKIGNFEAAYGVKFSCRVEHGFRSEEVISNSYILAPKESFELQENPKDPLFFYRINEEYFFLIHKWGDDLSIKRKLISILSRPNLFYGSWFLLSILTAIILSINSYHPLGSFIVLMVFSHFLYGLLTLLMERAPTIFTPNEWNSPFKE